MKIVILESPFAGNIKRNIEYARRCVKDCLLRGEAPMASHLLYTQPGILDDNIPKERELGINAGLEWRKVAEASVVYTDYGISKGMEYGIKAAEEAGIPVKYRSLFALKDLEECVDNIGKGIFPELGDEVQKLAEEIANLPEKNLTEEEIREWANKLAKDSVEAGEYDV